MKIMLLMVGRTSAPWLAEGIGEYLGRVARYVPFEAVTVADARVTKGMSADEQCRREGEALLQRLSPSDRVVLLDERGRQPTSRGFAEMLQGAMNAGVKRLVFVIGGPYGFSAAVRERAGEAMASSGG